jgi:Protein of unknown function (DUF3800)
MAYFLFVDESGHDLGESPYEVLGGVAIEDRDLWNLIQAAQEAEIRHFGRRYSGGPAELKGKKLLKRKVFRLAAQLEPMALEERTFYAKRCLDAGGLAGRRELTALAQAKLSYVSELFDLCARYRCKAFASIINTQMPRAIPAGILRKDYTFLLERFFYFLEDCNPSICGAVVFDELEKSQSHILVDQMSQYFQRTAKGRARAGQVIPEPFFVHSDLTTGIQLADLIIYTLSWGFRIREMVTPARVELLPFVDQICSLRYRAVRDLNSNLNFNIWSFAVINDLGTRENGEE